MIERYRFECPDCGSRQVRRRSSSYTCEYRRCDTRRIDPVDLRLDG